MSLVFGQVHCGRGGLWVVVVGGGAAAGTNGPFGTWDTRHRFRLRDVSGVRREVLCTACRDSLVPNAAGGTFPPTGLMHFAKPPGEKKLSENVCNRANKQNNTSIYCIYSDAARYVFFHIRL